METRCANTSAPEAAPASNPDSAPPLLHGGNPVVDDVAAIALDGSLDEAAIAAALVAANLVTVVAGPRARQACAGARCRGRRR